MNFKVFAAAVALLVICAQAKGDFFDYGTETEIVNAVFKAVDGVLNSVGDALKAATLAVQHAVDDALKSAGSAARAVAEDYNNQLQNLTGINEQCLEKQSSLQMVYDKLDQDLQDCVRNASANANSTLSSLKTLNDEAVQQGDHMRELLNTCLAEHWEVRIACYLTKSAIILGSSAKVTVQASQLAEKIIGDLVVKIPVQSSACFDDAVKIAGTEATAIIDAVRECVNGSRNPTTTASA